MRWFGQSWGLLLVLLVLTLPLSSCGKIPSFLSGGTNVAANTQVGKTNNQTLGFSRTVAPEVTIKPNSEVETVNQSNNTTNNTELPTFVWILGILLFIMGWVTDTPSTYIKRLTGKR